MNIKHVIAIILVLLIFILFSSALSRAGTFSTVFGNIGNTIGL